MSQYKCCPTCRNEAKGGFSEVYIELHKCQDKGHIFCNNCKNGDRCPLCQASNIQWNYDKAFTEN